MKLQREEVAASRTRAQYIWNDTPSLLRVLIVCATRAAEVEGRESFSRLTESARRAVHRSGAVADVLDLSWSNWSQPDDCNAHTTPDCPNGKLGGLLENLGLFAVESAEAGVLASRVAVAARKLRGTGHLSAAPRVRS